MRGAEAVGEGDESGDVAAIVDADRATARTPGEGYGACDSIDDEPADGGECPLARDVAVVADGVDESIFNRKPLDNLSGLAVVEERDDVAILECAQSDDSGIVDGEWAHLPADCVIQIHDLVTASGVSGRNGGKRHREGEKASSCFVHGRLPRGNLGRRMGFG